MKLHIDSLYLKFKKSSEIIKFDDITYIYGQMGAGKTSIAKIIDYCLGGNFDYTPALQQEFVSAQLVLKIDDKILSLLRPRDTNQVIAETIIREEKLSLVIPLAPDGELIPNTGIENLSDFIYYVAGIRPPKVRKSKKREDSELQRLSIRNLLWYCYLDQDHIDSDFFHLNLDANPFKRLQSKDVLRFIIGFHQEKVAELELELEGLRTDKRELDIAAETLKKVLLDACIDSSENINDEIVTLTNELQNYVTKIDEQKEVIHEKTSHHAIDELKNEARYLFTEIDAIEESIDEIGNILEKDNLHLNELKMLKLKVKRDVAARAVLGGVSFVNCPSCAKTLPERAISRCAVCGQEHESTDELNDIEAGEVKVIEKDADARISELSRSISNHESQLLQLKKRKNSYAVRKRETDININRLLKAYDSAYLSNIMELERKKYAVIEKIEALKKMAELPLRVNQLKQDANNLMPNITALKDKLNESRSEAEKDTKNLKMLETIFLQCLNESKIPGIKKTDIVEIKSPHFLPDVMDSNSFDLAVTSFANLSSGGKKTLFKCCFTLAFHILARRTNTILPSLIILDSPMKNISERENKEVFESFMEMVYRLASTELVETQIIIIDKEYYHPPKGFERGVIARHMQPESTEHPPLIPYYKGH